MKVILQEDIENLGFEYEVVNVKPGYARNFLIPQKKAKLAIPSNMDELNQILDERKEIEEAAIAKANSIVESMKGLEITIPAKVGEGDKLFGSINNADLTKYLSLIHI